MMSDLNVAIAGLGAIGQVVASALHDGMAGLRLTAIAARDADKARRWLDAKGIVAPVVPLGALPAHADLAVECAPGAILADICTPMLTAGKRVMVLSAAALLSRPELDRPGTVERRPDHRAERRTARPRRGDGGGGRENRFRPHDHAQAAERPRRRAASCPQ